MKVGLFFGSFNPIHIGHMILAEYVLAQTDIEQVWFIVSPHNPFKEQKDLLDKQDRLDMVNMAILNESKMRVSNIEFDMPDPSYTCDTLTKLKEQHPEHNFHLIVGNDVYHSMTAWKNFDYIKDFPTIVYPRSETQLKFIRTDRSENTTFIQAPVMPFSSTFIRKNISEGKSVSWFLPPKVSNYIKEKGFYK